MVDYQIDNHILTVNGNIVQFRDRIDKALEIDGILIVLLRNEPGQKTPKNNIYAVDQYGNILWQIQDAREEIPGWENVELHVGIKIQGNKLLAFSNLGFIFEVNPENGKIKEIGWTK